MGFFDRRDKRRRRGRDDFNSPVEEIDLSTPPPALEVEAEADDAPEAFDPPTDQIDITAPELAATASLARYGVDQAVELMESLPQDNLELAVRIVKQTLESTNIQIPPIIEEANQRLEHCASRTAKLHQELAQLDEEIRWRKAELERLAEDQEHMSLVRERLTMAEQLSLTGSRPAQAAPDDDVDEPKTSAKPSPTKSATSSKPAGKLPSAKSKPVKKTSLGLPKPPSPAGPRSEPTDDDFDAVTEVSKVPDGSREQLEHELKKPPAEPEQATAKSDPATAKGAATKKKTAGKPKTPARGRKTSVPPPVPKNALKKPVKPEPEAEVEQGSKDG
ncbi:MAG: hypothetical protein KJO07_05380 [Deltaproteobacteria bacterium]|nr:hypothetical protein [Deltaproteobacteria bacterium]